MVIKITSDACAILNHYDINSLLTTVPSDYTLYANALKIYQSKIKPSALTEIKTDDLTKSSKEFIKNLILRSNLPNSIPNSIILSYLIECVCDCGKINTKDITRALNNYYSLFEKARHNEKAHKLFNKLLDEYSNSGFYIHENKDKKKETEGLSTEGIAYFLTLSPNGRLIVNEIENIIKED